MMPATISLGRKALLEIQCLKRDRPVNIQVSTSAGVFVRRQSKLTINIQDQTQGLLFLAGPCRQESTENTTIFTAILNLIMYTTEML